MGDIYSFLGETKPFDDNDLNELVYNLMENSVITRNKYTIYIPSKGRPTTNKITRTLDGLEYIFVVEPQDYDAYCKVYPVDRVLQMDKNNQGLAYVRNFIKTYSTSVGETKHWQLDDDIECFKIRKRNTSKNVKIEPLLAFSIVEKCMDMFTNVAVSGINSDIFAFSRTRAVQRNKLTCQCILVNNTMYGEWDFGGVEDWHYTLSVLENGYCTLAFDHLMTQSPAPGKHPGGCTDIHYADNVLKPLLQKFVERWPNRFYIKEEPNSSKKWRLKAARKFFGDYKQKLILNDHESIDH